MAELEYDDDFVHLVHTPADIELKYSKLSHSIDLITGIIEGERLSNDTIEEKRKSVADNVKHLELMVTKDFWTTEDFLPSNSAIIAGNNYLEN